MPEHCIKQYEEVVRSRVTRSKPLQVMREKIKPHSYKYHAIDPKAILSSSELNSINSIISYSNLEPENNYRNLISSNHYNVPTTPNNDKHLKSLSPNHVPPALNQYNGWRSNSANNMDAPVKHIVINDLVPLHNGRRVDHVVQGNNRVYDDSGNPIHHGQYVHGRNRDYEDHADPVVKMYSVDKVYRGGNNHYVDRGSYHGDHSHYIDLESYGHRGEYKDYGDNHHQTDHVSSRRKGFQKRHMKRVHQSEPTYSQESLEVIYNSLRNAMNMMHYMNSNDETSKHTSKWGHLSRNRKRARHHERVLLQDYKRILNEYSDHGLIYNYAHDTKRGRYYPRILDDDIGDSYEYRYTLEHNYNDVSHEHDIDKYVDDDRTKDVRHRRTRQNFPQDAMFIDDYFSPFSMESVFDIGSQSSGEESVHIPIPAYQSSIQSMLRAIETDIQSQPITPQIGVLPFLGVSAVYHQPISKNSVDLIKDVAHLYQDAAKEQYKLMEKYFPPLAPQPPFPLPDFSQNVTNTSPIEYYPKQRKDNKLMNKIRHTILKNAKHFREDGETKHKVNKGGSSQDNIFLRQYK